MMNATRLSIYLNDHLAAAIGAAELARRSARSNQGTALGQALDRLVQEIEQDRAALRKVMNELSVSVDPAKVATAWLAEKLGRFKLNGSLVSYSPLSRLEELELLGLGVEGKLRLWRVLKRRPDLTVGPVDLDGLIQRAQSQRRRLERHRLKAAEEAL